MLVRNHFQNVINKIKFCQVQCWRTILKQNYKTHTETVHPDKPASEKLKGAFLGLFKLA